MKRKIQIIVSGSAACLMAFTTLAQETTGIKNGGTEITEERPLQSMQTVRLGRTGKASDVIGMQVRNYDGESLGKVDDLAVDLESGRIVEVVLSTGGIFGLGVMMVPVPPGALHHDVTNKVIHMKSDMQRLKSAPRYGMSNWAQPGTSNEVVEAYRYHGHEPYFTAANQPGHGLAPTLDLGHVQRVTKLMGAPVKNVQGETLGKVENIVLDLSAGRVVCVVVSFGGLLGIGDALSAVPPAAFDFNSGNKFLRLDFSKEALSRASHFKSSEWPDFSQPGYAAALYGVYKIEPYFAASPVTTADGTTETIRARNTGPLNQGSSQADVDTTAQIRKEIRAGKDMSVNAHNVQIFTSKGQVTLRGPVDTAEEKRLIGEIAIHIALVENVNNQLEVK